MSGQTFLVTGSTGCIGAWVLRNLVAEGARIIATDLSLDAVRPRLLLSDTQLARIRFEQLDVTDAARVKAVVAENGVTHVIHLAGLQVPFCRANPSLGAMVNVVGTVNVFEAARASWGQVQGLVYASSVAVLGSALRYPDTPVTDDAIAHPETLYGVYKQANEGTARLYWEDWQIPSIGLRPYIVYGVGRDQGLTSDISKAMLAVAAGRPFHIKFGGPVALQYADDVARLFILSARSLYRGAAVCNLRNDVVDVGDFVTMLRSKYAAAAVTWQADRLLPYPAELDDSGLGSILGHIPHTPLETAIDDTITTFRELCAGRHVDYRQLEN
jgi:UDP-glucuronate 4-epimerase